MLVHPVCAEHAWTPRGRIDSLQLLSLSAESAAFFQVLCKKQLVEAGRLTLPRAAVQLLQFCGCRLRLNDSHYNQHFPPCGWHSRKTKMVSDLTKQCKGIEAHVRHHYWNDIPSWTTRRTRSSSLATTYKRSNALGEAFFHLLGRPLQLSPCQY